MPEKPHPPKSSSGVTLKPGSATKQHTFKVSDRVRVIEGDFNGTVKAATDDRVYVQQDNSPGDPRWHPHNKVEPL